MENYKFKIESRRPILKFWYLSVESELIDEITYLDHVRTMDEDAADIVSFTKRKRKKGWHTWMGSYGN